MAWLRLEATLGVYWKWGSFHHSVCAQHMPSASASRISDKEWLKQGRHLMASDTESQKTGSFSHSTVLQLGVGLTEFLLAFLSTLQEGCQAQSLLATSEKEKDSRFPHLPHQVHQTCPYITARTQPQKDGECGCPDGLRLRSDLSGHQ